MFDWTAYRRHPSNPNIRFFQGTHYNGLPIQQDPQNPPAEEYLENLYQRITAACHAFETVFAVRFDLYLPPYHWLDTIAINNAALDAFFNNLREELYQIPSFLSTELRYFWVREHDAFDRPYYQVLLLLDQRRISTMGNPQPTPSGYTDSTLYHGIMRAWNRALGYFDAQVHEIALIPYDCHFDSYRFSSNDDEAIATLFFETSALCKTASKPLKRWLHVIGGSRRPTF